MNIFKKIFGKNFYRVSQRALLRWLIKVEFMGGNPRPICFVSYRRSTAPSKKTELIDLEPYGLFFLGWYCTKTGQKFLIRKVLFIRLKNEK